VGSEIRTAAPAHATGAVIFVPLEQVAPDDTFRLRPEGDVSVLAGSIGRLGQLRPVELRALPAAEDGPRFQTVAGFRRLAALRLLLRDRVLARVHEALGDEDAWSIALVEALAAEPLAEAELLALRDRLAASGVAPWALELVEEARARAPLPPEQRERYYELLTGGAPAPAPPPEASAEGEREGEAFEVEEVSGEDFARELAVRMSELNQDLATAYGAWKDLPEDGRRLLLVQARYVAQLLPYLEDAER
jgi:hypothetical protein